MQQVEQKKASDSNAALSASPAQSAAPSNSGVSNATPAQDASQPRGTKAVQKKTSLATHAVAPKVAAKPAPSKPKAKTVAAGKPSQPKQVVAVEDKKNPGDAKKDTPKAINLTGRRDPFVSPVVSHSMVGSGCSTGKRCLAIDQISLKGVVKAEAGMIAVVVNALDKAYFLRENDPVFNGYVVKITGDSIIFKETIQDKLGKPFTREVTKKISTPAV